MAKYLVKEKSFVNGAIHEAGSIIDYKPPEGTTVSGNLEPVKGKRGVGQTEQDAEEPAGEEQSADA